MGLVRAAPLLSPFDEADRGAPVETPVGEDVACRCTGIAPHVSPGVPTDHSYGERCAVAVHD